MGSIAFTDATGAATLDNGMTSIAGGVGSRFRGWTSNPMPIGPVRHALGTGAMAQFKFRTDYCATFSIEDIPNANVTVLDRLIEFLRGGGVVSVTTGDSSSRVYATCCLAAGGSVEKEMFNPREITWKLTLTLVNLAGAAMTCTYESV